MKNYINPEIEIIEIDARDVITTSPGTESPIIGGGEGIWDFNQNQ